MDWSSVGGILGSIRLAGAVLAAILTLVACGALALAGGRLRGRPGLGCPVAPGLAFVAGAAVFAPAIALVQVPLQVLTHRWVVANLATANQAVLAIPVVLLSGLVQEPAKLLAALVGSGAARPARTRGAKETLGVGVAAGAGFGFLEAAVILSLAFRADSVPAGAPAGLGVPALERALAILFHLSSTGLALYAWRSGFGRGLAALAGLSLYHALFNYVAVLWPAPARTTTVLLVEGWVAVGALVVFAVLVAVVHRTGYSKATRRE